MEVAGSPETLVSATQKIIIWHNVVKTKHFTGYAYYYQFLPFRSHNSVGSRSNRMSLILFLMPFLLTGTTLFSEFRTWFYGWILYHCLRAKCRIYTILYNKLLPKNFERPELPGFSGGTHRSRWRYVSLPH
jgi:hypothetical protein